MPSPLKADEIDYIVQQSPVPDTKEANFEEKCQKIARATEDHSFTGPLELKVTICELKETIKTKKSE
jgi:hypothetical protein